MATKPDAAEKKKNELAQVLGAVISWTLRYLFYGLILLRDSQTIKSLSFVPDPDRWFKQQARGLAIIGILLLSLTSAGLFGAYTIAKRITPPSDVTYLSDLHPKAKKFISKSKHLDKIDSVVSEFYAAVTKKKTGRNQAILVVFCVLIPLLAGLMVESFNKMHQDTKQLRTVLEEAGCFGPDKKAKFCLTTGIGYYIEVTGSTAQGVATNEGIWKRLSVEVDDKLYFENPKRNTLVFYKRKFSLKEKYFLNK